MPAALPPAIVCQAPRAVDGDTIRCRNVAVAIRLAGIDAPELPGHCRRGRVCVAGNGETSKRAMAQLLRSGPVRVQLHGEGGYGRALGRVWAGRVDVNCAMIAGSWAVPRYQRLRC